VRSRKVSTGGRVCLILVTTSLAGLGFNALRDKPVLLMSIQKSALDDRRPLERITAQQLIKARDEGRPFLLLDVRSASAFAQGHIPNSVSIPEAGFVENYSRLGLNSMIRASEGTVVLCQSSSCPAAEQAASILLGFGHRPVWVLEGGWEMYQQSQVKKQAGDAK